ncbi:MAG: hypothetical protein MJ053_03730 [Elusimicrobiaceae bacterium]|nr:hypothetical protein [Elusimicrobiaceae bacterium]
MDKDKLIASLRNLVQNVRERLPMKQENVPAQPQENIPTLTQEQPLPQPVAEEGLGIWSGLTVLVAAGVCALVVITLLFWMIAKHRAENLTAALDPEQLQGLTFADKEFNPTRGVTYVQIQEGHDRNVAVSNLGSTLPIISRFNLKTFTDKNYEIVGAAPWALTTNFASNMSDPELMRYLLSNEKMIQAFLERPDVEPLLADPQMLLSFTEDAAAMREFFEDDTVQEILSNELMLRTLAGSRFMSHLLTSPAVKYYRDRPQEAAAIIRGNVYLAALQQNPYVQKAVKENPYLKTIATQLLSGARQKTANPAAKNTKSSSGKKTTRTSRGRGSRK